MTDGCLMLVGRWQYEMLKKLGGFPRNPSIAPLRLSSPWLLPDGRHVLAPRLERVLDAGINPFMPAWFSFPLTTYGIRPTAIYFTPLREMGIITDGRPAHHA